ncbi:hypothetical protein N7462_009203 [Penicillium macrosclerotiorum]|uniref:uncharacterized protein n=1 Tax=Penicillium macrosclerotiorum TaxID=303699 RepID=UPI002547F010|nr:uncharacterized protein N7462_009203 [Penicillium macrosclerotiorum]KAJ5673764.1 hypothetical protein N7462_009203 [Penicillium macrosclerotiorum]
MTDLTPVLNSLLAAHKAPPIQHTVSVSPSNADEFLKEAYRIVRPLLPLPSKQPNKTPTNIRQNAHISSLLKYLHSIRPAYLSTTTHSSTSSTTTPLTDPDRDSIDSSTSLLLRDLAASISNLSSAESLRQDTQSSLLRARYGHSAAGAALFRWAGADAKSPDQLAAEERARTQAAVREAVLWYLRHTLDGAAGVQRNMVEKRIERVREREKSVLYKSAAKPAAKIRAQPDAYAGVVPASATALSETEAAAIEAELSPAQLQLFAEENDTMLRHYEDTLGKVQNAEKSLLEISSLQETLVSHLSTQEEYISQLVSDVDTTQVNVGQGNRELKRATERRSTAQAVFWGTVGLCTWLVVWDLVF